MKKRMIVKYIDDLYKTHIASVTSMIEVDFIRERFQFVELIVINK
jgi:hypothetical protein